MSMPPESPKKSVIFDLDGTLWDSTPTCARAWNLAIQETGIPYREMAPADVAAIMGLTHEELVDRLFVELPLGQRRILVDACLEAESLLIPKEGGRLYDGVRDGIASLAKTRQLFIVSNCEPSYLEAFLNWSGLRSYFIDWESHGNTRLSKAENIKFVCKRNELLDPVYVGDTAKDQLSAFQAGVRYIHVNYGFGMPTQPCARADSFGELITLL